jgi:hypothetical protein
VRICASQKRAEHLSSHACIYNWRATSCTRAAYVCKRWSHVIARSTPSESAAAADHLSILLRASDSYLSRRSGALDAGRSDGKIATCSANIHPSCAFLDSGRAHHQRLIRQIHTLSCAAYVCGPPETKASLTHYKRWISCKKCDGKLFISEP